MKVWPNQAAPNNDLKACFLASLEGNPDSFLKKFPGLNLTNQMIWNQLQNLIAQQRNFFIQTLITEQSAQINAEIAAKVKEAKTFKCTFEGTNSLLFDYKFNFYF